MSGKYRDNSIFELCPEIRGKTLLYVGISNLLNNKHAIYQKWFYDLFKSNGFSTFTILERFEPNVDFAREYFKSQGIRIKIVCGDVQQASRLFESKEFDVTVWWHGPEHVENVDAALKEVAGVTRSYLIIGCPNGYRKHGASYNNPYEAHLSGPDEKFFKERGYITKIVRRPVKDHLTAIKDLHGE